MDSWSGTYKSFPRFAFSASLSGEGDEWQPVRCQESFCTGLAQHLCRDLTESGASVPVSREGQEYHSPACLNISTFSFFPPVRWG